MNTIKFKDKSDEVKILQDKLILLGYSLKADRDFGQRTLTAINNFQKLNNLSITDFVDETLSDLIDADVKENDSVDKPSMKKILTLHPKIRFEVLHLFKECNKKDLTLRIAQGYRTFAEQDALYAQGRTKPGPIITKAKGGLSNHNYGLSCYDDKTEILTNSGFKLFKDLLPEDKVATFNNGVCNFETPLKYINYFYEGEMIHIKTRSVDQLVTPNHKMVVKKKTNQKWDENWRFIRADEINHQYKIPTNGIEWLLNKEEEELLLEEVFEIDNKSSHSKYSIINKIEKKHQSKLNYPFNNYIKEDVWWEFMGWYLSEGFCAGTESGIKREHSSRYKVAICQTEKSNVYHKLKSCIEKTGFIFQEYNGQFIIHSKELHSILFDLGNSKQKYIPNYLLNASQNLLQKLFISLIDGDGCYYKTHYTYYTASKKMCDSFVELSLKLGYSVSINIREQKKGSHMMPHGELLKSDTINYEIITRNRNTQELRNGNSKKLINTTFYSGFVYCVTTNAGAVFIKRNGKISVGGNCDFCLLKKDGSISWSLSEDLNDDGNKDWMQIVEIFKANGYSWGGDWKFVDNPHIEKTFGNGIRTLLNLHNLGKVDDNGYVII